MKKFLTLALCVFTNICFADTPNVFRNEGTPNAVVLGNTGDICTGKTGAQLYIKSLGYSNTGWVQVVSSGGIVSGDPTTPSFVTPAGATNTGYIEVLGKTSGGIKITAPDTGKVVTITETIQTVNPVTLTIPDFASVADTFVFTTLAQTLANKTLTTPNIGAATGTSLVASSKIVSTSPAATGGVGYATGAGGAVTQATNRTTGVTMVPNPCMSGTITTNNASLAGLASADFIVTDSAVAIGDTVVVSIQSGSNSGGAFVSVAIVTTGTFTIRVSNNNAAAGIAETGALLINFAIIKAVSS